MNEKPPYKYIFDMLDYADAISVNVTSGEYNEIITLWHLIYVEDVLDKYARGLVCQSTVESGQDGTLILTSCNRKDVLRDLHE